MATFTLVEKQTIETTIRELEMIVEDYYFNRTTSDIGTEMSNLTFFKDEADTYQNLVNQLKELLG